MPIMPRRATVHFVSLRSSLVNLPISIYGPLLERTVRPQSLAVHLTRVAPGDQSVQAYVGWTGMASASSFAHFNSSARAENGHETIEIDPQYAQALGLSQADLVEIGLLHDLPLAKSVGAEPVTSDDWEIIEIHASHVESTLLSQVRVANVGQEIDVWVLGRTRVRLRVVSLEPSSKGTAQLLTTDTEISIAPKLHKDRDKVATGSTATSKTQTTEKPVAANDTPRVFLRNLPAHVVPPSVHVRPKSSPNARLAYLSRRLYSRLSCEPLHTLYGPDRDRHTYVMCDATRVVPPPGPTDGPAQTVPESTSPKTLNPGREKEKDEGPEGRVYVGWDPELVDNHIYFPRPPDNFSAWDIIKVTAGTESVTIPTSENWNDEREVPESNDETPVLAGVDDILARCTDFCMLSLAVHAGSPVVHGVTSLLVTGRPGSGKTSIIRAVAKNLERDARSYAYTSYVDLARLVALPVSRVKTLIGHWYDNAFWHAPAVILLDNMDALFPAELEHAESFRTRHLTELFLQTFSRAARPGASNTRGILLIATAESQTALHPALASAHLFSEIIKVPVPNKAARRDILASVVESRLRRAPSLRAEAASINFTVLASETEGYSPTDLHDLVARAVHASSIRAAHTEPPRLTSADFERARNGFTPRSLRDVKLHTADVAWSDIGGLTETKKTLRETLEWPTKYGPIFAQAPLRLRSGLLLYGYPGCGKTLLASAVASECGLNFISVKGPEILNKYIGASEKSVRDLFERASAAKPCVLFFDEFDAIAPKRGHDSTGVTDRVVNQLLTQMDGAEGLDGVYVLAATSRPDLVDGALLRPGRLDKSILCDMPNAEERTAILHAVSRKVSLSPDVNLRALAEATAGFSGADLQAVVYDAHLAVVHASIDRSSVSSSSSSVDPREDEDPIEYVVLNASDPGVRTKADEAAMLKRLRRIRATGRTMRVGRGVDVGSGSAAPKKHEITDTHLRQALKTMRPSVSADERKRLERIYREFVSDRSGDLPVPPDVGGIGNRATLM